MKNICSNTMKYKGRIDLTLLILWYGFGSFALCLFLYGFFPIKSKFSSNVVEPPTHINGLSLNASDMYQPEVNRVILMVIDALRIDFVREEKMPYLSSIIQKDGCVLPTKAESPTVTMPRIKAMTTGSVPQFIDIVLNFASSKIKEDNFLNRAQKAGKKMLFYGDNTWLSLYPEMFLRSEGTSSFFVSDFIEVDNNVTRHLDKELQEKDWDILILHYLGLDHIGHLFGPFHPFIKIKLEEMDDIIKDIHSTIQLHDVKTVMLICGDHGMRDSGGHGGSSEAETMVPLAVLGINCDKSKKNIIAQTDIAATISALMGLPLPADSVGKIIPELLFSYSMIRRLYILYYNALNLIEKGEKEYREAFKYAFKTHEEYLMTKENHLYYDAMKLYEESLNEVSEKLIKTSSIQHIPFLYIACSVLIMTSLAVLIPITNTKNRYYWLLICSVTIILIALIFTFPDLEILTKISKFYCLTPFVVLLYLLPSICTAIREVSFSPLLTLLIGGTIIRTILLSSTSFIEEEHQIWFYLWGSFAIMGAYEEVKNKCYWKNVALWILLLVGLRIIRHLNHTGKFSSEPDISDWLREPEQWIFLNIEFFIGLIGVVISCSKIHNKDKITSFLSFLTTTFIFWYRVALHYHNQTVFQARVVWILILITASFSYLKHRNIFKTLAIVWILWTTLLLRPQNVLLIPTCVAASSILLKLCTSVESRTLSHIWLATVFFHCQGNCNTLASIDISPGYVGLSDYSPFFTTFQVICHGYTFPILSLFLLLIDSKSADRVKMWHIIVIYRLLTVSYFCIVILLHKDHLFVWSVFSPKLLIESIHTGVLLIGLLFYKLGSCKVGST